SSLLRSCYSKNVKYMKHMIALVVLIVASGTFCVAQTTKSDSNVPDFSGHWVSESVTQHSDIRPLQSGDASMKIDLVINQSGSELKVKESTTGKRGSYSRDLVFFLDGRGESNEGFTKDFVYDSKTILKDKKVLINTAITIPN